MAQHVMATLNHRMKEYHAMQQTIVQLETRLSGVEIREHQRRATATTHNQQTDPAAEEDRMGTQRDAGGTDETPLMKRFRSLNWKNIEK